MLLRHVRWDVDVGIVLLMRLLPPRILHVLGIEGRRRCMVVGIRIDGRLRRRTIHVVMVLLLAARLFVVGNRVARAHVVIIIHGDGGTREAGATGSCWQRWRLLQGGRSRGGEDGRRRAGRGQHGWRVRRAMGERPVVVVVVSGRRCSDEVRAGSFCRCARRFVSFAECFHRGLCGRRGEEMQVVFWRRAVAGVCRRWCWRNGELGRVQIACTRW